MIPPKIEAQKDRFLLSFGTFIPGWDARNPCSILAEGGGGAGRGEGS